MFAYHSFACHLLRCEFEAPALKHEHRILLFSPSCVLSSGSIWRVVCDVMNAPIVCILASPIYHHSTVVQMKVEPCRFL